MESERRPADIGESAVVAGQAHRRIDMLLDKVSELTAERDQWMRSHTELGRQLNSAHEMNAELSQHYRELASERDAARAELTNATNRALDEVIAALAGWVEGARSNCLTSTACHCGGSQCGTTFDVDDIRNMIEDARRQLGAERDFDTVIDSGPEAPYAPDSEPATYTFSQFMTERQRAERAEALMRAGWRANQSAAIRDIAGQRDAALAERDEVRAAFERDAAALEAALEATIRERDEAQTQCRLLNREIDDARASLDDVRRERDRANAMVANLHTALKGIVKSIDSQEPKSCNCGATSLLPRHTDPKCPHHGDDAS